MNEELSWPLSSVPREGLEDMLRRAITEVRRLRGRERSQADYQAIAAGFVIGATVATAGFAFGAYLSRLS